MLTTASRIWNWLRQPGHATLFLGASSAASLLSAYTLQYGFGVLPCDLCHIERVPHLLIALVGLASWRFLSRRPQLERYVLSFIALTAMAGGGVAFYHVGVEESWWTSACAASATAGATSAEELRQLIEAAPVVRCSDKSFVFLGLSLAAWNGLSQAAQIVFAALFAKLAPRAG